VKGDVEFRVLGPLSVKIDGASIPLGGPKQRALLALLLLAANRVVSRERLIEELFAEQSLASADHALRNHVSRLRKALAAAGGEPRIVARAPGYLLRVEPGELDLERFEGLLADGREAAGAGDPAAAADALRTSAALWEGRPFADLEFEPFVRVEVERLEELRLAAVEERIDAELALGRQLPLVAELESLADEHPYRERFRAQLMLALYRSGRQAEGLDVYRRTRTLLRDELGLEPGVELQELERAILVQDPSLRPHDGASPPNGRPHDVCPYKGLAPFEGEDAELFCGRERLVAELVGRVAEAPLLALVGPSGSGKSSLLRAGLVPALTGRAIVRRPGETSAAALRSELGRLAPRERIVLAVDQFEEIYSASVDETERRAFVDTLVDAAWDPERRVLVLIALRADFFGRLAPYVELADLVGPNHVLLPPMSATELRRAIATPAERVGLHVEPALVDALVDDVAGEAGALPLLETTLHDLWHERDGRTLSRAAYDRTGGVRGAVGRHAEAAYRSLDADGRRVARGILLRLVSTDALTRRRASRAELDADQDDRVDAVLATLVERRLLVAGDGTVELVHEALLERWERLARWIEEDMEGRRVHHRLAGAASAWAESRREPSELFRGAQLAAALEWADGGDGADALNRLEREFLEASRTAFARETRRLRVLLVATFLLLLAAVTAGAVAFFARGSATREATAAVAQRLGAQALSEPRLDRSLLLAREGVALDDDTATRSNLLAALLRSPAALAVLHPTGAEVLDSALDADGRLLAVRGDGGVVTVFDTRSLRPVGRRFRSVGQLRWFGAIVRPVRALAFSPDGRTIAVGDSDGTHATVLLVDTHDRRARVSVTDEKTSATADVAFAPGGRRLVDGEIVSGRFSPPALVLVVRRTADGIAVRRSRPIPGGRFVGFAADGLLVTSGERTSYLLDPRTLARRRTYHLAGAAALAPGGELAAFGQGDGSVRVLSLQTGAVRQLGRQTGRVIGLAFAADARVLATTSDDGSVDLWDVPAGRLRETFRGHAGAAVGPVFSRDGRTLFTGSHDGSVLVWDVRGGRRLGRPFRFAPDPVPGAGPASAQGAGAVAASPDGTRFVTSPGPNRITIWRTRDLAVLGELRGPCGRIESLAWSRDGRLVAATGDGEKTVVWDVETGRIAKVLGPGGSHGTAGVAFSPDVRLVGTAGIDGALRLYDLRSGKLVRRVRVKGSLQDLDFGSDGRYVTAAGLAGQIVVWDLRRHRLARTIHHPPGVQSIRFSPDGRTIVAGDFLGDVDFWDAATGRRVGRVLGGQNGDVLSVTYSPDGRQLVTTSSDGQFRLWDVSSGKLVGAALPGADVGGWGTFSPDGRHVIAAFWSGLGMIWDVDPGAWQRQACTVAHRQLTRDEWRDFLPDRGYRRVCG
jgi:WD40 repeat protein/DNA-binding SARP family transcriptional activator